MSSSPRTTSTGYCDAPCKFQHSGGKGKRSRRSRSSLARSQPGLYEILAQKNKSSKKNLTHFSQHCLIDWLVDGVCLCECMPLCLRVSVWARHSIHMEVRGQSEGVGSLFAPKSWPTILTLPSPSSPPPPHTHDTVKRSSHRAEKQQQGVVCLSVSVHTGCLCDPRHTSELGSPPTVSRVKSLLLLSLVSNCCCDKSGLAWHCPAH